MIEKRTWRPNTLYYDIEDLKKSIRIGDRMKIRRPGENIVNKYMCGRVIYMNDYYITLEDNYRESFLWFDVLRYKEGN